MLRIAIVEDDEHDLTQLRAHLNRFFENSGNGFVDVRYPDAETLLASPLEDFDIVFMDIELPGLDGMSAIRKLRANHPDLPVVFLTKVMSLAVDGYQVNALDYIVKPVSYEAFELKMRRLLRVMERNRGEAITLTDKQGIRRLFLNDILYVEVNRHNLMFHTSQGVFVTRGTMKTIERELEEHHFLRCNNCFLVNLRYVTNVDGDAIALGDITLPVSRARRKEFLNGLTDYLGI
ncbi:LytTR family DNA-binding domain-containing protein [Bifidobacterium sp. SO4]|uniref:LytR/AlgR family response regulator transcription factor n=1 Tax=Bifidobacterium sp. SO4 TaxID=2809030 RepID=UPI001BDC19CC|nr:LytTR family DNA-binding domain-containing protein [Bifidobacterium sp. SO4]MBT1170652.1 response regulator transcription factor [Bifidobacterium sp. SO4]